jgi:hypothetical protein
MTKDEHIVSAIEDGSIDDVLSMPLSGTEIDTLIEATKTDPGAPFESRIIARITATKRADLPQFVRLRARLKDAKVPLGELDQAMKSSEPPDPDCEGTQGRAVTFKAVEPCAEPVDGAILLDEIAIGITRYVMLSRDAAYAVALWIVHSYCFDVFSISPRLVITAPEKRCGKTTLLRVIQALVPKALPVANITAAAMFRTIEKFKPTLLIDEADTFLRENEELRGVINSGHEREGRVIRLVGDDHEPSEFSTFCPTVIATIGSVPSTIEDRAIVIPMRRRLPNESIERFRIDRAEHLEEIASKIARWVADNEFALRVADPETPQALHDRAADNWRPLIAIADLARWEWPLLARSTAVALLVHEGDQGEQSRGVALLTDIFRIFVDKAQAGGVDTKRISSTRLVEALVGLVDRPWASWSRGNPITSAAVARILKNFSIIPNTIKLADGKQPNGYKLSQFRDAFERYLPTPLVAPVQSSPGSPTPANPGVSGNIQGSPPTGSGEVRKLAKPTGKPGLGEGGELSNSENRRLKYGGVETRAKIPEAIENSAEFRVAMGICLDT